MSPDYWRGKVQLYRDNWKLAKRNGCHDAAKEWAKLAKVASKNVKNLPAIECPF